MSKAVRFEGRSKGPPLNVNSLQSDLVGSIREATVQPTATLPSDPKSIYANRDVKMSNGGQRTRLTSESMKAPGGKGFRLSQMKRRASIRSVRCKFAEQPAITEMEVLALCQAIASEIQSLLTGKGRH